MIYILTSTKTILKADVRPQESKVGDSVAKGLLHLKLKQQLTSESFNEQEEYLETAAIAAYVSLNGLDQRYRYRASVNLTSMQNETFNFTHGSSSSGLGYALSMFDAWWRLVLQKPGRFKYPIFATGEVLTSGQINPISHLSDKIRSTCDFVNANKQVISQFYLCYPELNNEDITDSQRREVTELGGTLIPVDRLQSLLGFLLGDDYDGDPLGRWEPFKGLNSFNYEDSVRFFGREKDVERLYVDLKKNNGALIVTGASASGKTSLVNAGLIPRLEQEDTKLHWAITTPSKIIDENGGLVGFIVEQLNIAWRLEENGVNLEQLMALLKSSVSEGVDALQSYLTANSQNCFLCLDQYEIVFVQKGEGDEALAYDLYLLEVIARELEPVNVVLVLRNEYLSQLFNYQKLSSPVVFNVDSQLQIESWQAIIHEQASFSGLGFELNESGTTLDSVIVAEALRTKHSLPMVELLLEQLYVKAVEANANSRSLTFADYELLGGLQGILVHRARKILQEVNDIERLDIDFFDLFVGFNSEKKPYANVVNYSDNASIISEDMQKLIYRFIEAGLIVSSRDESNDEILKFVYDGFFKHWSELQTWIDESLAYLVWRNGIDQNFQKWKKSKLNSGVLEDNPKKRSELFLEGFKQGREDTRNPPPVYLIDKLVTMSEGLLVMSSGRGDKLIRRYLKESFLDKVKLFSVIILSASILYFYDYVQVLE